MFLDSLQMDQALSTSKIGDIEAVITYYCKKLYVLMYKFAWNVAYFICSFSNETYEKGNGWIEIFKPLLTLEYKDREELYALFASIRNRYIPR